MTVRVDFVDCSCVRRAVRSGANEKNGKEQEPWHSKSSAHQATLGRGSRAGYALSWEKTSSPVGSGGWRSRRWTTRLHLTVATRFLRNWLRSHYYDFVLR